MNCRRSEDLWTDYLEGTLAPPLEQELRNHFASCKACPELFAAFEEVVNGLHMLETPSLPDDVSEHILERTMPALRASRRESERFLPAESAGWTHGAAWLAAAAVIALVLVWRPPEIVSNWSRQISQSAHQAYSFGVRTYHQGERLLEELNVLRMTVGVAFEDRLDQLNERLKDLEEASRKTDEEDREQSRGNISPSSRIARLEQNQHAEARSLL